jgi:prophage regulatory protein
MKQQETIRYLREPQLLELTKLSKTTRWRLEKKGLFPRKRQLSPNAVGWIEAEIQTWLSTRCVCGGAE